MNTGRQIFTAAVLIAASVTSVWAWAGDIQVITHPSFPVDSLTTAELRSVFLLQRRIIKNGALTHPVLQKKGITHEVFVQRFLNRDSDALRNYYEDLVFTGKGTLPEELNSDAEVIAYVANKRDAIGYVSGSAETKGVKVLTILSQGEKAGRSLLIRVEPEYPKELHQRGIEGTVRLALTVSARGSVQRVRVMGGNPILAEAAEKAVREWVYSPSATSSTIEVSIPFAVRP